MLDQLELTDEALIGDLFEAYDAGRSDVWFWRQAVMLIAVGLRRQIRESKLAAAGTVAASLVAISLSAQVGAKLTAVFGHWTWTGPADNWHDVTAALIYRLPFLIAMCAGGATSGWLLARLQRRYRPSLSVVFAFLPLCYSLLHTLRALTAGPWPGRLPNSLFAAAAFIMMASGALVSGLWARSGSRDSRR